MNYRFVVKVQYFLSVIMFYHIFHLNSVIHTHTQEKHHKTQVNFSAI